MSLNANILRFPLLLLVICLIFTGCATSDGKHGYVPPEVLAAPSSKISDALIAFSSDVQKGTLASYRRKEREDMLRGAIRDAVMKKQLDAESFRKAMPYPEDILCKSRYDYILIATPVELTAAKAEAVKDVLKPPSSDFKELFRATRTKFTIDVTKPTLTSSYTGWLEGQGRSCVVAVNEADPFATRPILVREAGGAAMISAFKTLFETVWGIAKPTLVGALQNAEIERRNRAVQDFFADKSNTDALKADIERIERFLHDEFNLQYKRTAGISVSSLRIFTNFSASHWTNAMAVVGKDQCRDSIRNLAKTKSAPTGVIPDPMDAKTDPTGVTCLNNVYATLDAPMKAALDAADKFDEIMDRELPQQKLSAQIDTLSDLAQGRISDQERVRAMWGVLVRYATLYDTIKETESDANRKKIDDAIEALRKTRQQ